METNTVHSLALRACIIIDSKLNGDPNRDSNALTMQHQKSLAGIGTSGFVGGSGLKLDHLSRLDEVAI